jgi:hypothetical protein
MPPRQIHNKPTAQKLSGLPRAAYSTNFVNIQRSWIHDYAKKQLQHGVKELHTAQNVREEEDY